MYYYGGSSAEARENHAAYLLHFEIMKSLKANDATTYDLMGIAGKHCTALKNVSQFKLKFSKKIVNVNITYDLPINKLKYRAFSLAVQSKRKITA